MSDDEVVHSDDEGTGPTEAELAMQKRRAAPSSVGMDDEGRELLEANRQAREVLAAEIAEMKAKSEQRKKERVEEERKESQRRAEAEAERKKEEEAKRSKKEEEERKRKEARASKMAEFEKFKSASKPNFVITKREGGGVTGGEEGEEGGESKKSKEQVEAERKAILAQRIQPFNIDGMDASKLTEKCKDLHTSLFRVECEKYDLEKRFKEQQYDMMELAERARQMVKVGRGGLKRVQLGPDEDVDKIQERFAGTPSKVLMYSKFERTVDGRTYSDKHEVFKGPTFVFPAKKVEPHKIVRWDQNSGLPQYEYLEGFSADDEEGGEEEEAE